MPFMLSSLVKSRSCLVRPGKGALLSAASHDQRLVDPPGERWHSSYDTGSPTCGFSCRDTLERSSENISERSKKSSLGRPVRYCKYDIGKCSSKIVLQRLAEIERCAARVVAKSAATPCAENERRMAESFRDREHAMNPLLQQVAGFRLADIGRVRGGASDKAEQPEPV